MQKNSKMRGRVNGGFAAVYTAVDWCNAVVAHDDDFLRILCGSGRARAHINDECIVADERFRPIECAIHMGAAVRRIRMLLEAGAQPTTDALFRLYSGEQWQDYEDEVGDLLRAYGAQHNWNTFRLYLLRQQTDEQKIAAFVKHPEFIDSTAVEEKYIHHAKHAKIRRLASRRAACAVLALAKRDGVWHKDVAREIAKKLVEPACAARSEWRLPPFTVIRIIWGRDEILTAFAIFLLSIVAVILAIAAFGWIESPSSQRARREAEERWNQCVSAHLFGGSIAVGVNARTTSSSHAIAIGINALVDAQRGPRGPQGEMGPRGERGLSWSEAAAKRPLQTQTLNPGNCPIGWGQQPCDLKCVFSLFPIAPAHNRDTGEMYPPHELGIWLHASQYRNEECDATHVHLSNHHYGKWDLQEIAEGILKYTCQNKTNWRFKVPAERIVVVPARSAGTTTAFYCPANHHCAFFWDSNKCFTDESGFLHKIQNTTF